MIAKLFAPLMPADELRIEREKVEKRRPHLAFSRAPETQAKPPERDPFAWVSLADVMPVGEEL